MLAIVSIFDNILFYFFVEALESAGHGKLY